jgi:hypothetical protein
MNGNTQKLKTMDAKTIFENMTKGEWQIMNGHPSEINSTKSRDSFIQCNDLSKDFHGTSETDKANAELIAMMHRETVGKGINPEGVEKMKDTLKSALYFMEQLEEYGVINKDLIEKIEEALTAATLH